MDNTKDNQFYIQKMIKDLSFIIEKTENLTQDEIEKDEVLIDSIMFRLIQVAENSGKLTDDFKKQHSSFQWKDVKGMRNNIVHDYGNIDLKIVYLSSEKWSTNLVEKRSIILATVLSL